MKVNLDLIKQRLNTLGIEIEIRSLETNEGIKVFLTPRDLEITNGFQIESIISWRTISTYIRFGSYSLPLLQALESSGSDKRTVSTAFAKAAINQGYSLKWEINQSIINLEEKEMWPQTWKDFNILVSSKPFNTEDELQTHNIIIFEQETILGIIISLLEVSIKNAEGNLVKTEFEKLPEGAKVLIEVNKYERNLKNRTACINYYGHKCQVCDFDFEKKYGLIGKGFIHVHHIIPISSIGEPYYIDPISDLIPVCPNCHYMLHKKDPPFTIAELKKIYS